MAITKQQLIYKYNLKPVTKTKTIDLLFDNEQKKKIKKNYILPVEMYQYISKYGTEIYLTFDLSLKMAQIQFYCDKDKIMMSVLDLLNSVSSRFSLSDIRKYKTIEDFINSQNDLLLDHYNKLNNKRKSKYKQLNLFEFELKLSQFNCTYVKDIFKLFNDIFNDMSQISFGDEMTQI